MKPQELAATGLAYVLGVTVVYFAALRFTDDAVGVGQVGGTLLGVLVATWLYQSRHQELAPARVKLTVGGTLAILCVLQGLLFQQFLKWMPYPDIGIGFGVVGALVFSFSFWNRFGKGVIATRKK